MSLTGGLIEVGITPTHHHIKDTSNTLVVTREIVRLFQLTCLAVLLWLFFVYFLSIVVNFPVGIH